MLQVLYSQQQRTAHSHIYFAKNGADGRKQASERVEFDGKNLQQMQVLSINPSWCSCAKTTSR